MTSNKPYPVVKHELVTAVVDSNGKNQFKFKFNELLKNKKITGLTMHPNQYLTTDPDGNTLVSNALVTNKGYFTGKTIDGKEELNKIPCYLLCAGVNSGGTYEKAFPIANRVIDWEQSYITIAGPTGVLTNSTSFLLSVWYIDGETTCDPARK